MMNDDIVLKKYIQKFENLHVDKNRNLYTTGKAPHKPILLLSLIILYQNKKVNLADIKTDIYLREIWTELWKLLEYDRIGPIYLPLYHLKSDGFWNIEFKDNITPHQPKSIIQFNEMIKSISLKDDLVELIKNEHTRIQLLNALLNSGYFSEIEIQNLKNEIKMLDNSFKYEEKINSLIRKEFVTENKTILDIRLDRGPAFRRAILIAYDETCSVCGMKVITSSGISIIDAAHILPFSRFQNDDIRNGLALCKTHHWLFDNGLISIDPYYKTIVSTSIENEYPEKVVTNYRGQNILLPDEPAKYPSHIALDWYRKNIFQKR